MKGFAKCEVTDPEWSTSGHTDIAPCLLNELPATCLIKWLVHCVYSSFSLSFTNVTEEDVCGCGWNLVSAGGGTHGPNECLVMIQINFQTWKKQKKADVDPRPVAVVFEFFICGAVEVRSLHCDLLPVCYLVATSNPFNSVFFHHLLLLKEVPSEAEMSGLHTLHLHAARVHPSSLQADVLTDKKLAVALTGEELQLFRARRSPKNSPRSKGWNLRADRDGQGM